MKLWSLKPNAVASPGVFPHAGGPHNDALNVAFLLALRHLPEDESQDHTCTSTTRGARSWEAGKGVLRGTSRVGGDEGAELTASGRHAASHRATHATSSEARNGTLQMVVSDTVRRDRVVVCRRGRMAYSEGPRGPTNPPQDAANLCTRVTAIALRWTARHSSSSAGGAATTSSRPS